MRGIQDEGQISQAHRRQNDGVQVRITRLEKTLCSLNVGSTDEVPHEYEHNAVVGKIRAMNEKSANCGQ